MGVGQAMITSLDQMSPQAYGLTGGAPAHSSLSTAPSIAQSAVLPLPQPWHPDNPLFWLLVIAGASMGLIGFTVTGRAGPAHASAGVGK